jgi:septal ring factor EnvC (AmiA/AmiB activator)
MKTGFRSVSLVPVLGLLVMAGCGPTVPPPTEQLALAQNSVDSATGAGGYQYAPIELKTAQQKLTQAQLDMENKNNASALRLLQEAQVDAQLAAEKSRTAKAEQAVKELQKNLDMLQQEIRRNPCPGS